MAEPVLVEIEMPDDLAGFRLPEGVHERFLAIRQEELLGRDPAQSG